MKVLLATILLLGACAPSPAGDSGEARYAIIPGRDGTPNYMLDSTTGTLYTRGLGTRAGLWVVNHTIDPGPESQD